MPHDKNGTELNVGDLVKGRDDGYDHDIVGVVESICYGAESCNITVEAIAKPRKTQYGDAAAKLRTLCATAKNFEKVA